MRTGNFAAGRLRLDSCAWIGKFVRMLIRATARGSIRWSANRHRTRYTGLAMFDGHRLSVAVTHRRPRGPMLRVVCATHRGSSCMDGAGFFMEDMNDSPLKKLWHAIRKSRCKKGGRHVARVLARH